MRLFQVAKCVVGDDDNSRIFVIGIKRIFHIINKYQNPGILAIIRIFDPIFI